MTRKARRKRPQHQLINEHMPPLHYGNYLAIKSADLSLLRTQFTEEMANAKDRAKQFWSVAQANGERFGTADPARWSEGEGEWPLLGWFGDLRASPLRANFNRNRTLDRECSTPGFGENPDASVTDGERKVLSDLAVRNNVAALVLMAQ